jgi:hypothetical protein
MVVFGIARVKDEADVIEATVRRMACEVDSMIVVDNASTDGTRDLLADLARDLPLEVLDDPDVAYLQAKKMTWLAAQAAVRGADWVVPFDADEAWYSPFGRIADVLTESPDLAIAAADLYDHVPTAHDPADGSPLERIGWRRREPAPLPKVAARTRPPVQIHAGNHGADHLGRGDGLLVVRHYPYRTPEQMVRKAMNGAAAYAATSLPEHIGAHWRQYGALVQAHGPEALHDVFRQHFWSGAPDQDPGLIFDPCPVPACA